jgi:hypothetical protein
MESLNQRALALIPYGASLPVLGPLLGRMRNGKHKGSQNSANSNGVDTQAGAVLLDDPSETHKRPERGEQLLERLDRHEQILTRMTRGTPPDAPPRPARIDSVGALWRYPLLVIIPALLLGGLGAVLAHKKPVSYTAAAQVLVSAPAPGTTGELPGVVQSEQTLAGIYSREIDFNPVVLPLARSFHKSPAYIGSRLSASPLADAPIILVEAKGKTQREAITLANSAGTKLASFVTSQSQDSTPSNRAFGGYQRAAAALAQARANEQRTARVQGQTNPNPSESPAVIKAEAAVQTAQLLQSIQGTQYQNLLATRQNTPSLHMFQSAASATSNRTSNLELYIAGGLIAGLVLGAALATLMANRKAIRAARLHAAIA